jgi:hypothetical protein
VTPVLLLLATLVAAGGALSVAAREPRLAALGAFVALAGSAYVVDPLPGSLALGARLTGTVLASFLIWIALRRAPAGPAPSAIGLPGAGAIAIVAFAIGWLVASTLGAALASGPGDGPSAGAVASALAAGSFVPRAALGAAFALVALAAGPVLMARDLLRMGLGLLLLLAAADLLRNALSIDAGAPAELALAIVVALAGASVAAVVGAGLQTTGDLELRSGSDRETTVRHRPADEAHRRPAR